MSYHAKIQLFLYLSASEFFIAVFLIPFIASELSGNFSYLISIICLVSGIGVIVFSSWLQKEQARFQTFAARFENRGFQASLSVSFILGITGVFINGISWYQWLPVIFTLWLVGLKLIILFPHRSEKAQRGRDSLTFGQIIVSLTGLFALYCFLFIPSKIPTIFDGIPWDTKFEFVFASFLIPFLALMDLEYFRKALVLTLILSALIIKICVSWYFPETGLEIQVYRAEANDFTHVLDYSSIANPNVPGVMKAPFNNLREFPMEWVNSPIGGIDNNRIRLDIAGYVHVEDGEKLIFLVQGVQIGSIELIDLVTQNALPASIADGSTEFGIDLYNQIPFQDRFEINGSIIFKKGVQRQFSPVILKKDGTFTSAFESMKIWPSKSGIDLPAWQLYSSEFILNFLNYLIVILVAWGLLDGLRVAFFRQQITPFDLFLFATGLLCFFITQSITRINQPAFILPITGLIGILRLALHPDRSHSTKPLLFTIGFIFLLLFLRLDFDHLREVSLFPGGQDNVEYQTLARNIYVNGDFFLLDSPPRAYKVLFPYIVGLLHIFFGQSSAAQLFLNAWCAVLSGLLFFSILQNQKMSASLAYATSLSFLLVLCLPSFFIFYFRFGLIEPVAVLMLFVIIFFVLEKKMGSMFFAGFLTVLLRLDYIGMTFALILFSTSPILGDTKKVIGEIFSWLSKSWKVVISYACLLSTGPVSIIAFYFFLVPNYLLNAEDTRPTSVTSIFEGLMRIILGGNPSELYQRFLTSPLEAAWISLILVIGTLIAFLSVFYRKGIFQSIDIRWGIVLISFLMAYILVTPTGYSPRFSTPLLPLALTMIALIYQKLKMFGILSISRNSFSHSIK